MLEFNDLSLLRGTERLISGLSARVHPGQHIGLTGANGSGKSSLFALIRGELAADQGSCQMPTSWVMAHVAQETPAVESSALDYVLQGDHELYAILQQLETVDPAMQAQLHLRLEEIDGYTASARAARLLDGLGFLAEEFQASVCSFSGGWRMRLNLAQALMCRSDLLLLDEPTNHLDMETIEWLIQWLNRYPGTLITIAHDRYFLDEVCQSILHIEQQQGKLYSGNYSAFERQRAALLATQQAEYDKQQRVRAHLQHYVDRFRAQATKARQAQSRIKMLERMEIISAAHVDSQFSFHFREPNKNPSPLLALRQVTAGYAEKPILQNVQLHIAPGSRIGLLGPNGSGKSTLIKLLAGEIPLLAGEKINAEMLQIGYFAQHQLEQLDPQASPLLHLQRLSPTEREQTLRDFLGGFGFVGDQALAPTAPFSGGEKARLVLALLVWQRPNLLLLDEPTNHLDLEMRHALSMALQDFEGGMVLVSHDRALLESCCDAFLLIADHCVTPFDGTLGDYKQWMADHYKTSKSQQQAPLEDKSQRKAAYQEQKADQARRKNAQKKIQQAETRIAKLQEELAAIEQTLADPALYESSPNPQLQRLLAQQQETQVAIENTEELWFQLQEEAEGNC